MSNFSIKKQLWIAFALMACALIVVSTVAIYGTSRLMQNGDRITEHALPGVRYSVKLRADINDARVSELYHLLFENPSDMTSELGWWQKKMVWVGESRQLYGRVADTDEQERILQDFDAAWSKYASAVQSVLDQSTSGHKREAFRADRNELTPLIDAANAASAKLVAYSQDYADGLQADSKSLGAMVSWGITVACILAGLVSCTAILFLTASVGRAIKSIVQPMNQLAAGDLDVGIPHQGSKTEIGAIADAVQVFKEGLLKRRELEQRAAQFQEELDRKLKETEAAFEAAGREQTRAVELLASGLSKLAGGDVSYRIGHAFSGPLEDLRLDFNRSLSTLNDTLITVGRSAHSIDSGAGEIRTASSDLAQRTEQQAASLEETAAALTLITNTVKDSSSRAEEIGALVTRTRTGAEHSGDVVRRAVDAMQRIEKSSNGIGNIINVIDEIAFQTNLLALNAGVEAARAGETGRGFAVVAQEVRGLAQRSADAAKEIKDLINESSDHVRNGVSLVSETGTSLEAIIGEVQEINRHILVMVQTAREQATGLHEISIAVNAMDHNTQQNAAMVEQSTAASHGLAQEASTLSDALSQFKLTCDREGKTAATTSRTGRTSVSPARNLDARLRASYS